jgi:hypothetical protein
MNKNISKLVTVVILSLIVSACGKRPQVVTGVQVQSSVVNQDIMLKFKADLDLGNLSFPAVSLPILHPRGQTPIGAVELLPVLGGKNQIAVSLNLSEVADIQAEEARLPNGNLIPLIANNPTIVVKLGAGAQLYITVGANVTAIGVAIPIKTFDGIGNAVGGINLFPIFNIDKVVGAAGLFTSKNAGQNGFALVADLSQYVKMQNVFIPQAASIISSSSSLMAMQAERSQDEIKLDLSEHIPSIDQEKKINLMIMDLNKRGKRLRLH